MSSEPEPAATTAASEPSRHPAQIEAKLHTMAARLQALRRDRGLRLADLAAISGLSEAYLSRLEQGQRWPSVPALLVLAGAYGVEPSVLLNESAPRKQSTAHDGSAVWEGSEKSGSGLMINNAVTVPYDRKLRLTASAKRTTAQTSQPAGSPEELLGMAFAGCFSMSLTQQLGAAGFEPQRVETSAVVQLSVSPEGAEIVEIKLDCVTRVDGIDDGRFQEIAHHTKRRCVVARALMAVPVVLEARLEAAARN